MSLKLASAVLVAAAVTSGPAFACKGPTTLYADSFKTLDPAWAGTDLAVSNGSAHLTVQSDYSSWSWYAGSFIDSGDYCIDMVAPKLPDPSGGDGGIIFGMTNGDFYAFMLRADGQAAVNRWLNGAWLTPVSIRPAPGVKTAPNATNTLRVTFKGNSASAYVNDQLFITFNIPQPFQNSLIGLIAEDDVSGPITYQFSNLKITNVP
jgi:hypothetical protein